MKSLIQFLKESFFSDSEPAPKIVTKYLGLKYAIGEGNSESQYTICGEKSYVERGKVEGQDNVFVTVGWYKSLLSDDATIFVYTTGRANSKTMKLAACYGLKQSTLEKYKNDFNSLVEPHPNDYDVDKYGDVICVRCKDIDDMVTNIRNDWGKVKSYKTIGWKLDSNGDYEVINGVIQSSLV